MTTFRERFKRARTKAGFKDLRSFQEALPKGVRGSSYGSVHAYSKGTVEPPLDFIEAAAKVLVVELKWLRSGKGPQTARDGQTDEQLYRKYLDSKKPWNVVLHPDRWVRDALGDLAFRLPDHTIVAIQSFVEDVYLAFGPEAFGAEDKRGWQPGSGYSQGLAIEEPEVCAFVQERFKGLEDLPEDAPRWQKRTAVYALLIHLNVCEFGGSRDDEED